VPRRRKCLLLYKHEGDALNLLPQLYKVIVIVCTLAAALEPLVANAQSESTPSAGERALLQSMDSALTKARKTGAPCPACEAQRQYDMGHAPTETSDANSAIKSRSELINYTQCYTGGTGDFGSIYFSQYAAMIAVASKTFEVPESLVTCMILRESGMDKDSNTPQTVRIPQRARNGRITYRITSEAQSGLGQFMNGAMRFVTDVVGTPPITAQPTTQAGIPASRGGRFQNLLVAPALPEKAYVDSQTLLGELSGGWQAYYKAIGKPAPRQFGRRDSFDPASAIAATALYARYVASILEENGTPAVHLTNESVSEDALETSLTVAAGYNMGPFGAAKAIAAAGAKTPSQVRAAVESRTRNHLESIRNCMKKHSTAPPHGSNQKTCPL
jgi:hypothetical protein